MGAIRRGRVKARTAKRHRKTRVGGDGLTNRQRAFVNFYLVCWNATEAARKAGYRGKYLHTNASKLLQNTTIRALIDRRLSEMTMSANEVLARLSDEASGTLDYFIDDGGHLDFDKARKAGKMHLLKSFSVTAEGFRIEIYDAQAAKVHLGRHYNLFGERSMLLNLDLSKLTDEQIDRLADGENPLHVLADASASRTGAPTPAAEKPAP